MMLTYSTSQMDNFYKALASGIVKPSGVMNYIQHLFIAERCPKGASILDLCCGRALMVPLLKRYTHNVTQYVGIDISFVNLNEAKEVIHKDDGSAPQFPCSFIRGDVTQLPIKFNTKFDIIVYTSSLEHLDRESGIISLRRVSQILSENGTLYLSTPRTTSDPSYELQYKVHVYEWDRKELEKILNESGLKVVKCIGLLPPPVEILQRVIEERWGEAGAAWFQEMQEIVPHAFLSPVMAACFPSVAIELLYICRQEG
jgi:ubiquinone/menaquinone biosynthesis C-methylase UbiE